MEEQKETIQVRSLAKLADALAKAQGEMGNAIKDKKNPYFKSTYADLTSCFGAMRDPFAKHGLSICQTMDITNGINVLKTTLLHSSGEYMESIMPLPNITDPQKLGSAITYLRRFMLCAIAGIAPADDDDGNEASREVKIAEKVKDRVPPPAPKVSPSQLKAEQERFKSLIAILDKEGQMEKMQKALEWCQVKSFEQIPFDKLQKLNQSLSA